MPPHCDSLDGPVVTPARKALDDEDVNVVLPYVPAWAETEVVAAFERVLPLHRAGNGAKAVADLHFFETVVRLHRAGEGAPFTGLKPAGGDEGPIIPVAEQALETGSPDQLVRALTDVVQDEILERFNHAIHLRETRERSVEDARKYVEAMLGLVVYSHGLYLAATGASSGERHVHG